MEDDMDEKLNALDKLIEAVEAGTVYATMGHTMMCQKAFPPRWEGDHGKDSRAQLVVNAWNKGSLDAALALHEALLPGCGWKTQKLLCNDYYTAEVWGEYAYSEESGSAQNPARAWLLAVLKAYRSMQA